MKIIAYLYSDPLLGKVPEASIWGWEVDCVYQDWGKRQQLEQLIADCQQEPPDYLLVRRLEELGDSLAEIGDRLATLEALDIEVVATEQSYRSSQFNEAEPTSLKVNFAQLLQQIQASQRRQRLQRGHARNRLAALPPPGKAPYGYRRGKDRYFIDRSTAPVVKDFFEQFLLFGSLRGAVRYLEKRYGKKISVSTGRRWLTNSVYRGDLAYQSGEIISDTHAPILSRDEAAQIDRLLRRNRQLPPRTASAPRSLAGLVICQQCQSPMTISRVTTRGKSREYLYLRPMACPRKPKCRAIAYQKVLEAVITRICEDLPRVVSQLDLPDPEATKALLQQEIAKKQGIIEQLPLLEAEGILDRETLELRRYQLNNEISKIRSQVEQLPPGNLKVITRAVSLPQFWLDLSEAERRFYFREFIRQVQLIHGDTQSWELKLDFIF